MPASLPGDGGCVGPLAIHPPLDFSAHRVYQTALVHAAVDLRLPKSPYRRRRIAGITLHQITVERALIFALHTLHTVGDLPAQD